MKVVHEIRRRIRSQHGASLSMALLLFLVCGVIGMAVLTAGLTSAKRIAKIAEMDQRYYSVNSAARLLVDVYTSEGVIIEKTEKSGPTPTTKYSYKTYQIDSPTTLEELKTADSDEEPDEVKKSLTADAAYKSTVNYSNTSDTGLKIVSKDGSSKLDGADISVKIDRRILPNGSIEFTVYNATEEGTAGNQYKINMLLAAEKQETRELKIEDNEDITRTNIKWTLSEIKIEKPITAST